jgi:LuxR family transcriptional activator of bioluminescence operon
MAILRSKEQQAKPQLSAREREVLHWAAARKTEWEIGKILGLSEHTADKFIRSARFG